MKKQFSIKTRLGIVIGIALLNVAAVGSICFVYLDKVVKTYGHVVEVNMVALRAINEARNAQRDLVILVSNVAASDKAVNDADKLTQDFGKAVTKYETATKSYEDIEPVSGESALREAVAKGWRLFLAPSKSIVALAGSSAAPDLAKRVELAGHDLTEGRKAFRESFQALTEFHDVESKKWSERAHSIAASAKQMLWMVTLAGTLLVLVVGFKTAVALSRVLETISKKVSTASELTMTASQQISDASQQLASSSSQQASSLQETAASMEEINSMVAKNAENAQRTKAISEDSQKQVLDGKEVVQAMVSSIEAIRESNAEVGERIERSSREMAEIVKVIGEIEDKTKVINDIVFQTKLLSFNASVEAARAGENGKGFAVVAEEVGSLAQMSGTAAKDISDILRESTTRVESILQQSSSQVEKLMADNKEKLKAGIEIAHQCQKVLESLVTNVSNVNGMAGDIAIASQEQSQGVREVNSAVNQLDGVVQQTTAASQGLSSASQSLLGQTETLNAVAKELFAVVNGETGELKRAA